MKAVFVIVGAGAAGVFAAIRAAEKAPGAEVILLEAAPRALGKVKVSGGGRCNVTHDCRDMKRLSTFYPRGQKEVLACFSRFQVADTWKWFESRNVALKTEPDGRVFPQSDSSETIIRALLDEASARMVELRLSTRVTSIRKDEDRFVVQLSESEIFADKVFLATGGFKSSYALAEALGHKIVPPVPSLFSFEIVDERLKGLEGLSFKNLHAKLEVSKKKFEQTDPALITHWGMSGPLIIRLSAWAARELFENSYKAELKLDFLPQMNMDEIKNLFLKYRSQKSKRLIKNENLFEMPSRFWLRLCESLGLESTSWIEASNKNFQALAEALKGFSLKVQGKGVFKEEFVTCGGVSRKEIDFRSMESKVCPGLYLGGELIDVDGITGGFNFQFAWSSAYVGASAMAESISSEL